MDEQLRQIEQSILLLQAKYDRRLNEVKADLKSDLQAVASRLKVFRESFAKE